MRRILTILLSIFTMTVSAQTTQLLGGPGIKVLNRGDFQADSIFYLPRTLVTSRTPTQAGALRYQASDSTLYQWTGTAWRRITTDADTLLLSTRAWRQKGDDSLGNLIGLRVRFTDTASMLSPYLRKADTTAMLSPYYRTASATAALALKVNISDTASMLTPYTRGSGTAGYLPKFTSTRTFANSILYDDGDEILIDTLTDLGNYKIQNKGNHWMSGNMVIGSVPNALTANLHRLEVESNNPQRGIIAYISNGSTSSQTGTQMVFHQGAVNFWSIGQPASTDAFGIWSSRNRDGDGTQRLRIDGTTGNISIGQDILNWTATNRRVLEINGAQQVLLGLNINSAQQGYIWQNGADMTIATGSGGYTQLYSGGTSLNILRLTSSGEVLINTTTDAGAYNLQVAGAIYNTTTITTGAPTSGSAKPWRLGEAATVSPTSPNRTIRVEIDGTVYYIHAKTTND